MSYAEIVRDFGPDGIRDFAPAYGRTGAITDDTQMTLFTAEGLLRADVRSANKGVCHGPSVVHHAYLRWLKTQGETPSMLDHQIEMDGWLASVKSLWSRRAPGQTCLSSLREARRLGEAATNDSKGCGAVMRIAPVGLLVPPDRAFEEASEIAALTHGHPSGFLAAAFLSKLLNEIVFGASLADALQTAKGRLEKENHHDEVLAAVECAEDAASSDDLRAVAEGKLGAGWVAEEALSIALFSALTGRTFEDAVVTAVNHSGDSDSTGAIAGNICGVLYGLEAIPDRWLTKLELRDEIQQVADDLLASTERTLALESEETLERYPGH
jgi:ADP-ribosylglycohydrolase